MPFQHYTLLLGFYSYSVMLKRLLFCVFFSCVSGLYAQEIRTPYQNRKIAVRDSIRLDTIAVNPSFFKLQDRNGKEIDTSFYKMDFTKGWLVLRNPKAIPDDTLTVRYLKLPEFLTKEYSIYDQKRIVDANNLYRVESDPVKKVIPFDGLNTSGSITRGITVGNNQNAVVNSSLDLQITGKISDKVSLRASIQDTNIPLQEGGYSQKLDEFDQIFIELFSEKWNIRAGDLFLENRKSRFLNFNKKVQGIAAGFEFGTKENKTTIYGSAALVRGQYSKSSFTGQEGNQGPYKLRGPNGELYILVISGSERVYVNGLLLKRGESNDYVIDYNAGEVTFTSLFPVTSEMRIVIEYQYSDKNYTRFVTYGGATHETEKWNIGGYVYSESDVKNQPLQQSLSKDQVQALVEAGDNTALMTAPSAYADTFSENKVLYKKTIIGGTEVFEYSNNPDDTLFNVRFSLVGNNLGNYILQNTTAAGRIYQYVPPVDGVLQGNYEPIVKLIAPIKLQVATVMGGFHPDEKTSVDFELALSNSDQNLFSTIDDGNNQGIAGRLNAKKRLYTGKWNLDAFANYQYTESKFRTVERLFNIEFDRDWNLVNSPVGNQSYLITGLSFALPQKGNFTYQFEKLDFSGSFSGGRHVLNGFLNLKQFTLRQSASYLQSSGNYADSKFARNQTQLKYHFGKNWAGGSFRLEDNQEKLVSTGQFSALSQRFSEYGTFIGRGDSTRVYIETGYLHRVNDSLQSGMLKRVNTSNSFYLKSRLVKTDKSDLTLFANYRLLQFEDEARKDEPSLNARVLYNDRYFNDFVAVNSAYETFSGTIAQQEFSYVEVDAGKGIYAWNDYNGNGIQELEEFEIAPFPDQAKYVRVYLPNQVYIKTHNNKFSQSVTLNPVQWQGKTGIRKLLAHFYDQASFLTERKTGAAAKDFDINPFGSSDNNLLGLNLSIRNSLYYNRGKQLHSVTYNFLQAKSRSLLSVGTQETGATSHQLQYAHLYQKSWLLNVNVQTNVAYSFSENYASKNYKLEGYEALPKLSYLFSKNASLDVFYEFRTSTNQLGDKEQLDQQRIGTSFSYTGAKQFTLNGEFSLYRNKFAGNASSPVAYQMLEGLQPGQNTTWRVLLQKTLTQFLDINLNYQGRKSETSATVHTGSVQLRAFF